MDQSLMLVLTGCIAILLGMAPVGTLLDDFIDGIERFRAVILGLPPRLPGRIVTRGRGKRFKGQRWFAVAGAGLILIAFLNYAIP